MLTTAEMAALVDDFGDMVSRVSEQVAKQFASSRSFGHGWEIVEAVDIEQDVYEQFAKTGITVERLHEMEADPTQTAQGYIRTTARLYGAANQAKKRRRATLTSFSWEDEDDVVDQDWEAPEDPSPSPEVETVTNDLISRVRQAVETIISKVISTDQENAVRAYYLEGLDSHDIAAKLGTKPTAVRKNLQRARAVLTPEDDASLRAWRRFAHPNAKRPQGIEASPEALIALL